MLDAKRAVGLAVRAPIERQRSALSRLRGDGGTALFEWATFWLPAAIAVLAMIVVVWSLVQPLTEGLRGDELISLFRYSSGGPRAIWGSYIPNDHMLYELLTWALRRVTGDHSEAVIRFWAVVPAITAVGLLTWWLARRLDLWVGALFAVLISAAPVFIDTANEGRGYGLGYLAAALMVIGADSTARTRRHRDLAVFALGAAIGLCTLPVMVLAFLAMAGLLVFEFRRLDAAGPPREGEVRSLHIVGAVAAVGIVSFLFYAPVLSDLITSSSQQDGQQLPVFGFVLGPLKDLLQPSAQIVLHPVTALSANELLSHILAPNFASAIALDELLAAVLVFGGAIVMVALEERFLALVLLVPAIFTYLVLEVMRAYVISRFASYLLPGLTILAAAGLVGTARLLARTRWIGALLALAGAALSLVVLLKAYHLAAINARPQPAPVVSNDPLAFQQFVSPQFVAKVDDPTLTQMACSKAPFVLLQREPTPPQALACLKHRTTTIIDTLKVVDVNGAVVAATVWAVPGASH